MKTVMVIPTFWSREKAVGWQPGDIVYDHPTPIDQEGTLIKALESIQVLEDRDFSLVVLACSTAADIEKDVEQRVLELVLEVDPPVETFVISYSHLYKMHEVLRQAESDNLLDILSLRGYSNVRNMCLHIPYALGAEIAVLVDDDEYFDDPAFISKAREFIGSRFLGRTIDGVAGYYINAQGTYYDDVPDEIHWMTYWDRFGSKREAFNKVIPGEPRLKLTPFAFGGCMIIHRLLFRTVPFDPRLTRGEDTDYVLNARMFGFNFFLDNELSIQHRPPSKIHPTWQSFREDIFRLVYSRAKITGQTEQVNMTLVTAEDFDPYPGEFLKDTLDDKILKTNLILALDYLSNDRVEDAKETIRNIWLAQTKAIPVENPFAAYLNFQRRWRALRKLTGRDLGAAFSSIIQSGNIHHEEVEMTAQAMRAEFERSGDDTLLLLIRDLPLFNGLKEDQIKALISLSKSEFFDKDDILITEDSIEHALYVITKGKARITLGNDSEEVTELIDVGVGETLGEVALLIDAPHSATVTALEPTEVITFTRLSLATLMADNPDLAAEVWHRLAQSLSDRLRGSNERYFSHIRETYDVADELLGTQPLDEL